MQEMQQEMLGRLEAPGDTKRNENKHVLLVLKNYELRRQCHLSFMFYVLVSKDVYFFVPLSFLSDVFLLLIQNMQFLMCLFQCIFTLHLLGDE